MSMSQDRGRDRRGEHEQARERRQRTDADGARTRTQSLAYERARHALAGNPGYREEYLADPVGFARRFGLHPAPPATASPAGGVAEVTVAASPIHGEGVFSGKRLGPGD